MESSGMQIATTCTCFAGQCNIHPPAPEPVSLAERKLAAIRDMHAAIAPDGKLTDMSPAQVAERIRELAPVCRSAKWRDAVERYASFVIEGSGETGAHLSWAYSQGSVYFGYEVF